MSDLQSYLDQALKKVNLASIHGVASSPMLYEYDVEKEVREMIVSVRSALGITQRQLAEKSGVSQANISKIENGNYTPSIAVLKRIANGLGQRLVIEFETIGGSE
ncbi:MAG: helix-turn-helix domain-containing protein [Clostridiales bacterium]|nr:helix-turn-helix domain-containing protein [Clostridiales bacterium]